MVDLLSINQDLWKMALPGLGLPHSQPLRPTIEAPLYSDDIVLYPASSAFLFFIKLFSIGSIGTH